MSTLNYNLTLNIVASLVIVLNKWVICVTILRLKLSWAGPDPKHFLLLLFMTNKWYGLQQLGIYYAIAGTNSP